MRGELHCGLGADLVACPLLLDGIDNLILEDRESKGQVADAGPKKPWKVFWKIQFRTYLHHPRGRTKVLLPGVTHHEMRKINPT